MLECSIANDFFSSGSRPVMPQLNPVDVLYQTVLSCELHRVEKVIHTYQNDLNGLMTLIDVLGRTINSRELVVSSKKFSFRRGHTLKWGVVCEFRLTRARKILLLLTEPEIPSLVLDYVPGSAGKKSCDSPALLMKQIGKIAALPTCFSAPPLACSVQ